MAEVSRDPPAVGLSVAGIRLRHDARRPASWGSVALAAAAAAFVGTGLDASVAGFAVVTAAVVVGIGELPAAFPVWDASLVLQRSGWCRFSRPPLALPAAGSWLAWRLLWPLLGLGLAGAVLMARGRPTETATMLLSAGGLAGGLAALTTAGFRLAGLSAADTATATLLAGWLAAAAMALTVGLIPAGGEGPLLLVGFGCWLAVAGGLLGLAQWLQLTGQGPIAGLLPRQFPAAAAGPRGPDRLAAIGLLGVLPARSIWRRLLRNAAMLLALGGMIGWLLLDPLAAGRYALLAAVIFGGFGVPAAALLDGREVVCGWRFLIGSVGGPGPGLSGLLAVPTPGLQAAAVLAGHASLMLWPPLVVAVVAAGNPAALPALMTAVVLAVGAALASGGCVAAHARGYRGETVLAIGLGLLACSVWFRLVTV